MSQENDLDRKPDEALAAATESAAGTSPQKRKNDLPIAVGALVAGLLALCTIVVCIAGAILAFGGQNSVSGTITYRERMALPPDAVVIVQIQDVSRADAPANTIGEQIIHDPGQVPIAFEVDYAPRDIDEQHTYVLHARIEDGQGNLLFTTTQQYPVITHDYPTEDIELVLEAVYSARPPQMEAYIRIDEPAPGAVLDISRPIRVSGWGGALPEGNIVVQIVDSAGNVLAEKPTIVQAPDAGAGGEGPWSVELSVETEPGTAGVIYAYSRSPDSGHLVAKDAVEVTLGQAESRPAYIKIEEPVAGAVIDLNRLLTVKGMAAAVPEGNVVVQVLDSTGNVLIQAQTIVQAPDAGTGGEGPWSVQLTIQAEPGTAGQIRAFSTSPLDGSLVAEDSVAVSLGEAEALPSYLEIDEPAEGAVLDVSQPIVVSGRGGGLPEGNVVVQARDAAGNVLVETATILQGRDVSTGGTGTWSVELDIPASRTPQGEIVAFSPSPVGGGSVASAVVNVSYSQAPTLEGITWVWEKSFADNEATALFENGRVSGSGGCNSYQGTYEIDQARDRNTIKVGPLAATMMMCDPAIMDQEDEFLSALQAATAYRLEGGNLILEYPRGSLIFYNSGQSSPPR